MSREKWNYWPPHKRKLSPAFYNFLKIFSSFRNPNLLKKTTLKSILAEIQITYFLPKRDAQQYSPKQKINGITYI
jgi:hypothetical protein